jgi:glycosyltransferase involved in cell wall biosynthesis
MKISIGILAWNEEISVRTTIHSLFAQSLLRDCEETDHEIEILCIPNGCSDQTAQAARGALLAATKNASEHSAIRWQVCELDRPGKTHAWNRFVHELSHPKSEVLFLVDADIQIYMPDTLNNMLQALIEHPEAFISTDLPVKHVAFKERISLLDRLSLQTSGMTQSATGQLCGQLYCARASFLRRFRIPEEIVVDDGFIKKMAVSNLLTEPEDPERRLITAERASHVFEAYTRPSEVFATLRRQTAGYIIHRWIWEFVQEQMTAGEDAGQTMARLAAADPDWAAHRIAEQLKNNDYRRIRRIILKTRRLRWDALSGAKKAAGLPLMLFHLLMDSIIFSQAVRNLKLGKLSRVWRDTRTTSSEVAR